MERLLDFGVLGQHGLELFGIGVRSQPDVHDGPESDADGRGVHDRGEAGDHAVVHHPADTVGHCRTAQTDGVAEVSPADSCVGPEFGEYSSVKSINER